MVGMGLLVLMGLVRPSLKLIKTPVAARANTPLQPLSAVLNEAPERPGLPMPASNQPTAETQRIADAKRLALENPAAVANIVKGWVNGEAPA
jgi:flagellar M-ring protein FliF